MRTKKVITLNNIIFLCLIIFSIIPDIGVKFATAGFTWTAYRIVAASSMLLVLNARKTVSIDKSIMTKWIVFMAFWAAYGSLLLFIGNYADLHSGFVEWLSIFNGFIVFSLIRFFIKTDSDKEAAIRALYWLLNLLLIFALLEVSTGWHWKASAYNNIMSPVYSYDNRHMATGFMYNMNDFSAMLSCLSAVLIDDKLGKKRIISLLGVLYINYVNDATTCTFAMIAFGLIYLFIIRGGKTQKAWIFRLFFGVIFIGAVAILLTSGADLAGRGDFIGAVARQIINAQNSNGSLYKRIIIYKDAFKVFLSTGMMGMGPGGFTRYFSINTSLSGIVNPHSLIIEILTQYGIIVGAGFIWLLLSMYRIAKKNYAAGDETLKMRGLMVMAFLIIYFIVSFAPSAFIGYSYQWLLLAVMCSLLIRSDIKGGNENA